jgi:DNA replication protein DnaC
MYTAPSLLILDEIGYAPCSRQSADLLYNIIRRRHENRSLVLTINLSFKQRPTVTPTPDDTWMQFACSN